MNSAYVEKAKTLIEAVPYIKRFRDKVVVIKTGGSLIDDPAVRETFSRDIALLRVLGVLPVLVHGGGREVSRWMERIGKTPEFVGGVRVTDPETMELTEMVLSGTMNQDLVSLINRGGAKAVGLSGRDANLFTARRMGSRRGVDMGLVGEIETIDTSIISTLLAAGYVPVVSSISENLDGTPLNMNADYVAAALAAAMGVEKLILCTDVDGILIGGKLVSTLDLAEAQKLLEHPELKDGMIPKLECAIHAILKGAKNVHIINGRDEHAVILELLTDAGVGTKLSYSRREASS